jgi:hypothetical protein
MLGALPPLKGRKPMARSGSVAVVGVGHTRYGKLPEYDAYELGFWALKEALADSCLRFEDIDGLIVNRIPDYQRFCEIAGLNPSYVSITPGQGRFCGICIATGAALIRDGLATIVALVYGKSTATTAARGEIAMAGRATPTAAAAAGNGFPTA